MIDINKLVKYMIMFIVVTLSTYTIPTCGVLRQHAVYVGLIASTTFAIIDRCFPHFVKDQSNKRDFLQEFSQ